MTTRQVAAVMGGLVADAATLGLHWLYDPDRIAKIAAEHDPLFLKPEAANFEGAKGVFVHGGKASGDLSQYGETARIALEVVAGNASDKVLAYRDAYSSFFGAGGEWRGYIDRPTRHVLNVMSSASEDPGLEIGADDDQHPAVSSIAAVVAAGLRNDLPHFVKVTNNNADALEGAGVLAAMLSAAMLSAAISGADTTDVLAAGRGAAGKYLAAALDIALAKDLLSVEDAAEAFGRACHLHQGLPLSFVILRHANSFADAVRLNALAGGDSCGRAMIIGPVAGALYGIAGQSGIPIEWLLKLRKGEHLYQSALKLQKQE